MSGGGVPGGLRAAGLWAEAGVSPECSPGECTSLMPEEECGESACSALKMALGEMCVCSVASSASACPFFTDFLRRGWYL